MDFLLSLLLSLMCLASSQRHYWDWVLACSDWAVESQDRYYCTLEGKVMCKDGWEWKMCEGAMCAYLETPQSFCSEPVCSEGCDPEAGYCNTPNTCTCKVGYQGENCTHLMSLPSCQHGVSLSIQEHCVCLSGWTGDLCDVPVCREGCGDTGHCTVPGECLCEVGWSGPACTECVTYPGCDQHNGYCQEPWECSCHMGWEGTFCNQSIWSGESGSGAGDDDDEEENDNADNDDNDDNDNADEGDDEDNDVDDNKDGDDNEDEDNDDNNTTTSPI